jgi:hypothetical protein
VLLPVVEVIIDRVRDHKDQRRTIDSIDGVMIHRVGVDLEAKLLIGYDAVSICDAFTGRDPKWEAVAKVTGSQNPYTFFVGGSVGPDEFDGKIWQALRIDEIGHHARKFSKRYIGIGMIGDFRVRPPSERQWLAACDLCADLCLFLGRVTSRVIGHGEMPGAHGGEKAPGMPAACPGDLLSMSAFRSAVRIEMRNKVRQDAYWRLEQVGVQLP